MNTEREIINIILQASDQYQQGLITRKQLRKLVIANVNYLRAEILVQINTFLAKKDLAQNEII